MGDSDSPPEQSMPCLKVGGPAGPGTGAKAVDEAERRNADDDSARGSKGSKVDPKKSLFSISEDDDKEKKGKSKKKGLKFW